MAGFANTFDYKQLDLLPPTAIPAVLVVLNQQVAYYQGKLLSLQPTNFKTTEEFLQKWQFYRGSLEATNDLILIMKGKQDAD